MNLMKEIENICGSFFGLHSHSHSFNLVCGLSSYICRSRLILLNKQTDDDKNTEKKWKGKEIGSCSKGFFPAVI